MANLPTQEEVLEYFVTLSNWGRWGGEDELGTMNHVTPETRIRAARLPSEGVTVTCSRTLSNAVGPGRDGATPALHDRVRGRLCP